MKRSNMIDKLKQDIININELTENLRIYSKNLEDLRDFCDDCTDEESSGSLVGLLAWARYELTERQQEIEDRLTKLENFIIETFKDTVL